MPCSPPRTLPPSPSTVVMTAATNSNSGVVFSTNHPASRRHQASKDLRASSTFASLIPASRRAFSTFNALFSGLDRSVMAEKALHAGDLLAIEGDQRAQRLIELDSAAAPFRHHPPLTGDLVADETKLVDLDFKGLPALVQVLEEA